MFAPALRLPYAIALITCIVLTSLAQTKLERQKPKPPPKAETTTSPDKPDEPQDIETLKIDTDLVMVPVTAADLGGAYVPDLRKEDFAIDEDGVGQEISFFGTVAVPLHVVLMLDTSGSTQDKLRLIQQAAFAFVEQLQGSDRVKVISFDDEVRDRNEFTSDRGVLKAAINGTRSGQGTKVYDAVAMALDTIRRIHGRKAIVVFTDGVDWHSDSATYQGTVRWLDEEGVVVYPIRYDTRAEAERIARDQAEVMGPQLPTLGVIRRSPGGTAPTFPSDDPNSVPSTGTQPRTGPLGLPLPAEILRRRREAERTRDPNRDPNDRTLPSDLPPVTSGTRLPPPTTTTGPGGTRTTSRGDDSISSTLDLAYQTADSYLETIASKSGGRLLRADTLVSLPDAFARIAAELRTQYLLGYYPLNKDRDEHYRKIKVTTKRKNVIIRSRPGYLATNAR